MRPRAVAGYFPGAHALGSTTQTVAIAVDTTSEIATTPAPPIWKRPIWLAAAGGLLALGFVGLLIVGAALAWFYRATPVVVPGQLVAAPNPGEFQKPAEPPVEDLTPLMNTVAQYLKGNGPKSGGVEACIDLGVHYLDQQKAGPAEALFRRMTEHRPPPSSCYLVGRLGLAVTDAMNGDDKASRSKFMELFDPKAKDNRVMILNDYLTKKPEFAAWVNEADSHNIRGGGDASSKSFRRPVGKFPFRK